MGCPTRRSAHESAWVFLERMHQGREENILRWYYQRIQSYNERKWLIQFDNNDEDQGMCYDAVIKYADEEAGTFRNFKLPANPISSTMAQTQTPTLIYLRGKHTV